MKNLVIGMTVLYNLTKAEANANGYEVLPATVVFVNLDGSANLQVHGANGLYVEEIAHVSVAQPKDGSFKLSHE